MKVLILGSTNSRNAGGVFNSVRMLGHSLNAHTDVHFLMHDDEYSAEDRKYYEPMPLHSYTVKGPRNLAFSPDMYSKLDGIKPDVIHTQGIWMYFSYVNKKYHAKTSTPYVVTPHGMLDPWQLKQSFSKDLKKKIVLSLYETRHLQQASCLQALCKSEYDSIRAFGLKNPVAIIPNGTELPAIIERTTDYSIPCRWKETGRKTLLFLSRIHHKKGLDNLLKAWAMTKPDSHNWQLVIAGETKDTAYMQSLISATGNLGISDTVQFIGGQFGDNKETCFIDADAFILPSFSEGLPMAVLEAWAYKVPVIMTPFCNIPEGFDTGSAISISTEPDSIASGIQDLTRLSDEERKQMGQNGYNLVTEKFTWKKVAEATVKLYQWITGKGAKPEFVITN
ncbi:MAG: glycosyltransferase [Sphingobacteriaceae bacterium]|nr:glycosyltransferase [Sphingobacteriaceae bacterium]